ncbi:COG1361 S-layer family protein [Eubacterium sp.]
MKKLKGILSIFIVMIMALSVQIPAYAADAPKVTFSNFSVDKTTIKPGDIFTFTVTASSARGQYIDDASFKFSGGDAFSVYKGSDTEYVSTFGSSVTVSKTFICNNETTAGSHSISVSCNFSYSGSKLNGDGSAEANYSVMTSSGSTTTGNTPVLVMSYEKFAEDIKAGDKFNFDFYITNKSTAYDVRNVNVKINGGDAFTVVSSGDTIYKNGIAKNQTAEFSKKLICNKSVSSGYHPISLSVTYEYVKAGATEQGTAEATFTVKTAAKKHDSSVSLTPRLVVGSFNYGNKSIRGGKKFTLNFTIKNNSKKIKAKNVIIKLSGGDVFVVADGTDTISVNNINPNSTVTVSKKFNCLNTAQSGVHPITASISYEYIEGGQKQSGTDDLTMSVPVVQPDKVMFTSIDLADKTINTGDETDCAFSIVNTGKTVLNNGSIKVVDESGTELNSSYIGTIEAGAQYSSNYNLPITMNEPGDYKLTLVFEYENDNADKKRIKQTFKVHVEDYTDPFPTDPADTPDEKGDDDSSSSKTKVIIGVVAGVVGAAVIVTIIVKKKKKHNKKGKVDFNEEI